MLTILQGASRLSNCNILANTEFFPETTFGRTFSNFDHTEERHFMSAYFSTCNVYPKFALPFFKVCVLACFDIVWCFGW